MKRNRQYLALVILMALTSNFKSAGASFSEGFEAGTFSDWTLSVEYSPSTYQYLVEPSPGVFAPASYPFGPLSNPYICQDIGFVDDVGAPEGGRYLQLTPGGGTTGNHYKERPFTAPNGDPYVFLDRDYGVVLSREFSIAEGQKLSLWVNFYTADYPPFNYDDLEVRINGTTIYKLGVADVFGGFPEGWGSGWKEVVWSPPSPGDYVLSLASFQDDQEFSSASFDRIEIVPEPSSGLMLALGLFAVTIGRSLALKASRERLIAKESVRII